MFFTNLFSMRCLGVGLNDDEMMVKMIEMKMRRKFPLMRLWMIRKMEMEDDKMNGKMMDT